MRTSARAERRAASSQMGWPDGASAVCGSESPRASPTTCAVAAVPRNWHPPPGLAHVGSVLQCDLLLGEARSDGLHLACVLALVGQQRDAAGDQNRGHRPCRRQGHHHGRQSLVTSGHAQHAFAGRKGSHEAAQDNSRIVAIGQRIHHARGALGAPVAGIGACPRERHCMQHLQFPRCLGDQQADLVVPGVKSKSDGAPVFAAQAAMCTQDQEFRI
jgi:hypothetical protein